MKKVILSLVVLLCWTGLSKPYVYAASILIEKNSYTMQYSDMMYMSSEFKMWDGFGHVIDRYGNNDLFVDSFEYNIPFAEYENISATLRFQWIDDSYWHDGRDNVNVYLFNQSNPSFSHDVYDGVPNDNIPWDPYIYTLSNNELLTLTSRNELSYKLDLIPSNNGETPSDFYLRSIELSIKGDLIPPTPTPIPEPSTLLLSGLGLLIFVRTKKHKRA